MLLFLSYHQFFNNRLIIICPPFQPENQSVIHKYLHLSPLLFVSLDHPFLTPFITIPISALSSPTVPFLFQRGVNVLKGVLRVRLARWRQRQRSIHEALFVRGPERLGYALAKWSFRSYCLPHFYHREGGRSTRGIEIMILYGHRRLPYRCLIVSVTGFSHDTYFVVGGWFMCLQHVSGKLSKIFLRLS